MKKNGFYSMLAIALLVSMAGCKPKASRENLVSAKSLTADILEKYQGNALYEYKDALHDVERSHTFTYEIKDEIAERFKTITDHGNAIFKVFKDASFTQEVAFSAKRENGVLSIAPARNPEFAIPDKDHGGHLNDVGEYKDWGNASQYYLVQYYDLKTGEQLPKPIVVCFTIKAEMTQTPKVELTLNEQGIAGLSWEPIEGAKEYIVFEFSESKEGKTTGRYVDILASTKETTWMDTNKDQSNINSHFRTSSVSADNLYGELKRKLKKGEITQEEYDQTEIKVEEKAGMEEKNVYFGVIAINENRGTSLISNLIDRRKAASQIPMEVAYDRNEGGIRPNGDNSKITVERELNLISTHTWITMCDGSLHQKLVNYDVDQAKLETIQYYSAAEDEKGNIKKDKDGNPINFKLETIDCVNIPYTIEGTPFKGHAQITRFDKATYQEELKDLKQRQDALRYKTGTIKRDDSIKEETKVTQEAAKELSNDYQINATNGLSEYLALQMLNGSTVVNLDDFKESQNREYLMDAWYEAVYQNPLVLGVKGIQLDSQNNLLISYDQDSGKQYEKQKKIEEKVKLIIKNIIKDDMSDYEKEVAINDYLCQNAKYDQDALENAEKNNFKTVDKKFNDSFTAYGILINNKGVGASYAAAFQLLAQEAGLKTIVVTGNLNGTLPHVWNRIYLDGEWYTLDVTNNDNEFFANGLLNLSDSASKGILVEDDLYMMNDRLSEYKATNDVYEYYRKNKKYDDPAVITNKLIEELGKQNSVSLRTNDTLSEQEFYAIAEKVMKETNDKGWKGGYFMGVITLQK